ncbi:MAG: hypothetical protein JWM34_854 [Ilumatobacteraceae bacterium]|nr:hypothetical protein [Ilumatobacteraceae bacterium]
MDQYFDVPLDIVAELRAICTSLPEAWEAPAWTGTRWGVRQRTFAHVMGLAKGGIRRRTQRVRTRDVVIVTFRSQGDEFDALCAAGHPYFRGDWGRDVVGMVLDERTDWAEVRELLTDSYCALAPKKLVALVDRPADTEG